MIYIYGAIHDFLPVLYKICLFFGDILNPKSQKGQQKEKGRNKWKKRNQLE